MSDLLEVWEASEGVRTDVAEGRVGDVDRGQRREQPRQPVALQNLQPPLLLQLQVLQPTLIVDYLVSEGSNQSNGFLCFYYMSKLVAEVTLMLIASLA